jgi:signal transduction histidine kinase
MPSLSLFGAHRFPERLRASLVPEERERVERVLGTARLFMASASLVAIFLDPTEPTAYTELAYGLLIAYVGSSAFIFLLLRTHRPVKPRFQWAVHATDIIWPATITAFTQGPNSPFFPFFTFVLLAAAFRWGLRETLATALATIAVLMVQAGLITEALFGGILEGEFQLNRFIMRSSYLTITGLLLGYLAREEKQLRAETSSIARIIAKARVETGLNGTVHTILDDLLSLFAAHRAVLVVHETSTGRVLLWQVYEAGVEQPTRLQTGESVYEDGQKYFFTGPPVMHVVRDEGGARLTRALDERGHPAESTPIEVPKALLVTHDFTSFVAISAVFGEDWKGRLFLLDPRLAAIREPELHFLQTVVGQVAPAIYSVYLLSRLRERAGAIERARVARELHDGSIQSLIGLEMQVDVLRRQVGVENPVAPELARIQDLLRDEILNLRELMQQMKTIEIHPRQLVETLAGTVDRFQRETGISASFVCHHDEVYMPPRVAREMVRIVQEALVNVRKHSKATHAVVRLTSDNGCWKVVVDDDGKGFDFSGHLNQEELDSGRKGPLIIKERVRAIGGQLTVESAPGFGARLEITVPQKEHGTYE